MELLSIVFVMWNCDRSGGGGSCGIVIKRNMCHVELLSTGMWYMKLCYNLVCHVELFSKGILSCESILSKGVCLMELLTKVMFHENCYQKICVL